MQTYINNLLAAAVPLASELSYLLLIFLTLRQRFAMGGLIPYPPNGQQGELSRPKSFLLSSQSLLFLQQHLLLLRRQFPLLTTANDKIYYI